MSPRTCFGFHEPLIRRRGAREQSLERHSLTTTHKLSDRSPEPVSSSIGRESSGPTSVPQWNNSRQGVNLLLSDYSAGSPSADKILLFTKTAPVTANPSNCVHVLPRLGFGEEKKNYAASYRSVQEETRAQLPERVGAPLRAYC